jgi:hypothetical protein
VELDDFRKDFLETVRAHAAAEEDLTQAAFVTIASQRLMDAEELSDFEPCYNEGSGIRDRRLKWRVDGYSFDDADGSMKLLIADFRGGSEAETITQTECTALFSRLRAFVSEAMSGLLHPKLEESHPVYALAGDICRNRQAIMRFRMFLATDALLSSRIKDWPEDDLNQIPVEFHIWDISRFHRAFESKSGRDELAFDFRDFSSEGIPCLEASQTSCEYKAYLCMIPGSVLADLYDRYGSRLLERNVRSFLGTRGSKSVNTGIRTTILKQPAMFFAYNNGIAATASAVEVMQDGNRLCLTMVQDLQIVNGGQTTASLSTTRRRDKNDLGNIFVQMKLSVITPDCADEVIPNISRYANSQNKVSEADFFSNHPFHVRVETHSRHVGAPAVGGAQYNTYWFYERARGQYLNEQAKLTKSDKNRFLLQNPREHLITKTDLAKFENAWRGLPHIVCLGAQKNFREFATWIDTLWQASDLDFSEEYFRRLVAKGILWKSTERLVSKQDWYNKGYRGQIVAYAIAKLSHDVGKKEKGKYLDFRSIWNKQRITVALERQLALISEAVFAVILDPERGIENVTEWCKKKLCWDKVEALSIPLLPEFKAELIDESEMVIAAREGKETQKTDTGIEAQAAVVSLGAIYWRNMLIWNGDNSILTPDEESVVRIASQIPHKIPTDKQSRWLLGIKSKAECEGFEQTRQVLIHS